MYRISWDLKVCPISEGDMFRNSLTKFPPNSPLLFLIHTDIYLGGFRVQRLIRQLKMILQHKHLWGKSIIVTV